MDPTFNEEIIIDFDANTQEAKVTASKTFAELAIHLSSSGLFKTINKTNLPGTTNFYDKNTISLSGVFSDYMLYKNILAFLNLKHLLILEEKNMQDGGAKTVRISIVLKNCTINKPQAIPPRK